MSPPYPFRGSQGGGGLAPPETRQGGSPDLLRGVGSTALPVLSVRGVHPPQALYVAGWAFASALPSAVAVFMVSVLSILPANRVIKLAGFRNFNRWIGVGIMLCGSVCGEAGLALVGSPPVATLEFAWHNFSIEVPIELLKLFAVLMMGVAGSFVGQGHRSSRTAWDGSRVTIAPPDLD